MAPIKEISAWIVKNKITTKVISLKGENFMSIYDKLHELEKKDLLNKLNKNVIENKKQHDIAVKFGELGVSPEHMNKYNESISKIKEYEDSL